MKRYKAVLWNEGSNADVPIDTILLKERCYPTAEDIFYNKRSWERNENYYVEIEKEPRILTEEEYENN